MKPDMSKTMLYTHQVHIRDLMLDHVVLSWRGIVVSYHRPYWRMCCGRVRSTTTASYSTYGRQARYPAASKVALAKVVILDVSGDNALCRVVRAKSVGWLLFKWTQEVEVSNRALRFYSVNLISHTNNVFTGDTRLSRHLSSSAIDVIVRSNASRAKSESSQWSDIPKTNP